MRYNLILFFVFPLLVFGQKEFNNWHFGFGVSVSFNGGSAAYSGTSSVNFNEGTATVSDCEGQLLFYTDGNTVWDKNNNVMDNGRDLFAGSNGVLSLPPSQGALIVKRPETAGIYFIFTSSESRGVNYSIVNMNANGGLGSVLIKNTQLSTRGTQKLAVTYHNNGKDIWVVTHYSDNNQYESFLVTSTGVNASGISSFNGPSHNDGHGDLKISQDGKKIAAVIDFSGRLFLADFNNTTGVVTNTSSASGFQNPHGVEFSPDNSKMYINSTTDGVIQFDLSSGNNSSIVQNPIYITSPKNIYGSLQLGPDNRIYVTSANTSYLGVITNPNGFGTSSNYVHQGLFIGNDAAGYELTNVTLTSKNSFNGPNSVLYNNSCLGDVTQFSLANNTDVVDVLWNFGDPSSGLQNFSTIINPVHEYTSVGSYSGSVEISYACGSEVINFTVVISQPPTINLPTDQIVCSGVPVQIGVSPEANVNYSWSPSTGLSNSNSSNPTLLLTSSQEKTSINYTLTATNSINGCANQKSILIELTNPIANAGPDSIFCSLDTIEIGSSPLSSYIYSWSPSNDLLSPASSLTDVIIDNTSGVIEQRVYTLTASLDGCISTDDVTIGIKPLPVLFPNSDTTICSLDSIVLNSGGNPTAVYSWTSSEGLSSNSIFNPKFAVSNKDTGLVTFTKYASISFDGCSNTDSININVHPQAGVEGYQYLCPGFGVALNPYGKGVSYSWTPNQDITDVTIRNPVVNPSSSLTYYVNVLDVNGCAYLDSVFVDVNPLVPVQLGSDTSICRNDSVLIGSLGHPLNAIYDWTPKLFISNSDSNYTYVFPDSTKTYIITSQSDTCTGRDTIEVIVNQLPIVTVESDTSICLRDSVLLVASGAKDYLWKPTSTILLNNDSVKVYPAATTTYLVAGTDTNSCVNYDSARVEVRPLPDIQLVPDTQVCLTDSVQVVARGGVKYSWNPSVLTNDDTISNPFLKPVSDTRFIVTVTGANQCIERDTVDVKVNPLPVIEIMSDTIICEGTKAYLWANGGVSYNWSPALNLSANNIPNPLSSTITDEVYQVIVTDTNNCIDSATTQVTVNVNPTADFESDYLASCPGFITSFTDKSANADAWFWSFGDGGTSIEVNPEHTFKFGVAAKTQLIVGNNKVCFDTATVNFNWDKLEDYVNIEAPNVITPNGDKINDCFTYTIEGDFANCTKVEFYNRWGLKVYDSDEFPTCFRGLNEYNFQELSAGTYFYVISINDYVRNGFVEIIKR